MKVLIVNTSENIGGAAIAAKRLFNALNKNGAEAAMLVRDRQQNDSKAISIGYGIGSKWYFVWERFVIWTTNLFSKKELFSVSIANTGMDITQTKYFKEADVIHLHWINQGMLSMKNIYNIIKSGKPVVWTMHDMWPFTGICHYAGDCKKFKSHCNSCPLLLRGNDNDLSHKVFEQKKALFEASNIHFVACSKWLRDTASESSLLSKKFLTNIPNAIDTSIFKKNDKKAVRTKYNLPHDKKLLLFGSMKVSDKRKGYDYLTTACKLLKEQHPELCKEIGVVLLGKNDAPKNNPLPFPVFSMEYISSQEALSDIYNACDLYVTPSLQDNLPNTIMEAMSCGLPCVGFHTGGIPEMIEHLKNGYIAQYKSAQDFANGIYYCLSQSPDNKMGDNARNKVLQEYSESVVARKYIDIYQTAMNSNKKERQ
ncbi:MAG: glycosyltransferase family 4 protein [Bacteroidaceae bacterium]|nr:glycosyltransferase family 4 protein [Bacteroidaceae bacterium]